MQNYFNLLLNCVFPPISSMTHKLADSQNTTGNVKWHLQGRVQTSVEVFRECDTITWCFQSQQKQNHVKICLKILLRVHTHDVLPGGRYGNAGQVVGLEGGAAVLGRLVHCQLQLLAHRQGEQLLPQLTVICGVRQLNVRSHGSIIVAQESEVGRPVIKWKSWAVFEAGVGKP